MSGRLIILPKKSYCPWNPHNVQKVLHDEKAYLDSREQATKKRKLEGSRGEPDLVGGEPLQHVNLFFQEEKEKGLKTRHTGGLEDKHVGASSRKEGKRKLVDQKLKREIDPMKVFNLMSGNSDDQKPTSNSTLPRNKEGDFADHCHEQKARKTKHSNLSRKASSKEDCFSGKSLPTRSDSLVTKQSSLHRKRHRRRRSRKEATEIKRPDATIEDLRLRRARREERERQRQSKIM
eukprot:scaffold5517_cov135-Cylindrotheca_fusiformis.AAC.4